MPSAPTRLALIVALLFAAIAIARSPLGGRPAPASAEDSVLRWSQLEPDGPRFGHTMLMDASTRRVLVHGGERDVNEPASELRVFDIGQRTWLTVPVSGGGPVSRLGGVLRGTAAVIDPDERAMLVLCDCSNGPTHILDLETNVWSHAPNDSDRLRSDVLLAYDPVGDRAIAYGGRERSLDPILSDGYAYDLSASRDGWHALPPAPFALVNQAVAYEPRSGHVLASGGQDANGAPVDALWALDVSRAERDGAWVDISGLAGDGPPPRMGATLTVDPEVGRAVLYGGYTFAGERDDAWLLDYSDPAAPRWSALSPAAGAAPAPRSGHGAVWDAEAGRVLVYGGLASGRGGIRVFDDTWGLGTDAGPPDGGVTIHLPIAHRGER